MSRIVSCPRPSLSVVIPTFCEARRIEAAIRDARAIGDEVLVADAHSPDGTAALAERAGARVVLCPKGRGPQQNAGAASARGDVLLFLHADARLPPESRAAIHVALACPDVVGGNFRLAFTPPTAAARFFAWANHWRRRWLGIYYGDAGIFVRRSIFEALGGFRPLPLFEDYDLARRLKRAGQTRYLAHVTITASARRFVAAPGRTLLVWTALQVLFSCGFPAERLARLYRDRR